MLSSSISFTDTWQLKKHKQSLIFVDENEVIAAYDKFVREKTELETQLTTMGLSNPLTVVGKKYINNRFIKINEINFYYI